MKITGLSLVDFQEVTAIISNEIYGGNVIVAEDAGDTSNSAGARCQARLKVKLSDGTGSRRSASGRRGPYACWHAYRDVLHELFLRYPEARVHTGMESYEGMAGFLAEYPATAAQNVGSQLRPAYMPSLCECGRAITHPDWV